MRADVVIAVCLLMLGAVLSFSPLVLFSDSERGESVTRDQLTEEQISSLEAGPFANSVKDMDAIILTSALLVNDSLLIAGEFSGQIRLNNQSYQSHGSSDLILARLEANGTWLWVEVLGGTGNDRDVTMEYVEGHLFVKGSIFGEVDSQSGSTVGTVDKNGHQRIIGDLDFDNGTWDLLAVDPYGDLSANPSLWCGWR